VPIYDYVCSTCAVRTEVIHGIDASPPRYCPACGADGTLRKVFAAPSVHFKGSGWAKKDRSTASRTRTKASAAEGSGEGKSSGSESKGDSSSGGEGSGSGTASDSSSSSSSSSSTSTTSSSGPAKPASADA